MMYRHPSSMPYQLIQQREFVPFVIAGLAVLAVGTTARLIYRTKIRVDQELEKEKILNPGDDNLGNVNSLAKILQVKSIGIDIGSSNCRLSIRNNDKVDVMENSSGQYSIPAVAMNTVDGVVVGNIAKQNRFMKPSSVMSVYHILSGLSVSNPIFARAIEELNLVSPEKTDDEAEVNVTSMDKSFSASQIRTIFSKELFDNATAKDMESAMLPAILSVPNYFDDNQKLAAVESARAGGLNIIYAIPDALSSVLGMHAKGLCDLSGTYVVIDVGGKLTQLSLLDCKSAGDEPILLSERTLFSGSDSINDTIAKFVSEKFKSDTGIDLLQDCMAKQRLYDAIESLKIDLSCALTSSINVPYITADAQGQPQHLKWEISRSTFENLIADHTKTFSTPMKNMLDEVNITDFSVLKGVIIVGGGARIPIIQRAVANILEDTVTIISDKEPENVNVIGSAVYPKYY